MILQLKFVTEIIKPWEQLNKDLVKKYLINSDVSDFLSIAGDLALRLSHFPELANRKDIRTNKDSIPFNIIVDVADALKHNNLKDERNNKLLISSLFEGNEDNKFRFIRNSIKIHHNTYGISDLLEVVREAAQFVFKKLNFQLFWSPQILEGPNEFNDEVSLSILYTYQIAWTGFQLEFFKRGKEGELVAYDPPTLPFKLQSPISINTNTLLEYVEILLSRSINPESILLSAISLPIDSSHSDEAYKFDFIIKTPGEKDEYISIVQIVDNEIQISDIENLADTLTKVNANEIILVSKTNFSNEIHEYVCHNSQNIYLVELKNLEANNIPLHFFKVSIQHNDLKLKSLQNFKLNVLEKDQELFKNLSGKPLKETGKCFSLDKKNMLSIIDLCLRLIKPKNEELNGTKKVFIKPTDKIKVYYKIDETFIKVGLSVDFDWIIEQRMIKMPILSFEKNNQGVSIWNLISTIKIGENENIIKMSAIKYGDTTAVGILDLAALPTTQAKQGGLSSRTDPQ